MLDRLLTRTGRFAVRRRRAVLLLALTFAIVAGAVGGGVFARLGNAGFQDPSAPSSRALALLADRFGTGEPDIVLVVTARSGSVDDAAVAAAGADLTRRLQSQPDVVDVGSDRRSGAQGHCAARKATGRWWSLAPTVARTAAARSARPSSTSFQSDNGTAVTVGVGGLRRLRPVQLHHHARSGAGGVLRHPDHAGPARAGLRFPRRGKPSAARRRVVHRRGTALAVRHHAGHRRLHLRHQPGDRDRARTWDRLRPVRREPLPGGARQGATRTRPSSARCAPPDAPSCSPDSPSPWRCRRCWSSRSTSCVRSPTRASPSSPSRCVGAIMVLPATLSLLGRRVDSLMILRRSATPADEGLWARIARRGDADARCRSRRLCRRPARARAPVPAGGVGQPDDRSLPTSATVRQTGDCCAPTSRAARRPRSAWSAGHAGESDSHLRRDALRPSVGQPGRGQRRHLGRRQPLSPGRTAGSRPLHRHSRQRQPCF